MMKWKQPCKLHKKLQEVCNKLVEKSKLTAQEAVAIMGRIYFVNQLQAFESCHLIIEAIVENLQIKKVYIQSWNQLFPQNAYLPAIRLH